jgi:F420-nonreducing hydrogenase I
LTKSDILSKQDCLETINTLGVSGFLEKFRAELIHELKYAKHKLVWIHGAGCSGCTMSFLNCDHELLGTILRNECIIYHKTLLEQSGFFLGGIPVRVPEINIEYYLKDIEKTGGYVLVVEGALVEGPDNSGKYCLIGGETVKERIVKAANKAKVTMTLGTCASCGGIPGDRRSENVVRDFPGLIFRGVADRTIILNEHGITKPVVDLPGCPPKPEYILALLALLLLDKLQFPEDSYMLDKYLRFKMIKGG